MGKICYEHVNLLANITLDKVYWLNVNLCWICCQDHSMNCTRTHSPCRTTHFKLQVSLFLTVVLDDTGLGTLLRRILAVLIDVPLQLHNPLLMVCQLLSLYTHKHNMEAWMQNIAVSK